MMVIRQSSPVTPQQILESGLSMKTFNIATIPADGIGPEVIEAGVAVLDALAARDGEFAFNFQNYDWGSDYYKAAWLARPSILIIRPREAQLISPARVPTYPKGRPGSL